MTPLRVVWLDPCAPAEIAEFGDAEGGVADLAQLQTLLDRASPPLDDESQQEKVRWAALQAALILKRNAGALEALVAAIAAEERERGAAPDAAADDS